MRPSFVAFAVLMLGAASTACKSESTDGGAATCASPGGPVSGAPDTHCGTKVQATNPASCSSDGGTTTGSGGAGGAGATGGATTETYATMYGTEGDDDDCKYHVVWSSSAICENADVTFDVTLTDKSKNTPATGAGTAIEAYLNDTHPAPSTGNSNEGSPGTYSIGPVGFDAPGKWTVRFHFYENCSDIAEDSPHGHAAFFVNVP